MPYKDPEKQKEANRKAQQRWRARNPDKKLSAEKNREYGRTWRSKNPGEGNQRAQKWAQDNPERQTARCRKWSQEHPESGRERTRRRRALKKNALGYMPKHPERILMEEQGGLCLYCSGKLSELGFHMEHKVPLSRDGLHDWSNVCLSCPDCNLVKGTRTAEEFMS